MNDDKTWKLERRARQQARWEIIQAANRHKVRSARRRGLYGVVVLFGMRHLQQAVFTCRQTTGLVDDQVLVDAGFNPPRHASAPAETGDRDRGLPEAA